MGQEGTLLMHLYFAPLIVLSACSGDWAGGASFPLWYAHYDGNPSFSDFAPFAGWNNPSIKQYNGDVTICGADVDENWSAHMLSIS